MAVQAQHLTHDFPHDLHAYKNVRALPLGDEMTDGSLYFDDQLGPAPAVAGLGNAVFGDMDLAWNDNTCSHGFVQRKRARVIAEAPSFLENPRAQGPLPVGDVLTRALGAGAASTSGRMTNAAGLPQDLISHLYHHQGMEIDALVRVETERMRAGLELARRRHVRAVVSAAERAAAGRLQAADAALEFARYRNATLSERLGQISAEGPRHPRAAPAIPWRRGRPRTGWSGRRRGRAVLLFRDHRGRRCRGRRRGGIQQVQGTVQGLWRRRVVRATAAVPAPVPMPRVRRHRGHVPCVRGQQERLAPCPALLIQASDRARCLLSNGLDLATPSCPNRSTCSTSS